jgi:hypothetical protein
MEVTWVAGGIRPLINCKASFTDGDPRLPVTLTDDKKNVVKYVRDGGALDGSVISRNNNRVLRFADVLLLKAEAVLQSGGSPAEAIDLVNQVRTRARRAGLVPENLSTTETDKATIMQWIMDERLRELAGEGHRWFDLRRWHMAGYITLNNAYFSSLVPGDMEFKPNNILFPIPTNETDVNPNVVQNPDIDCRNFLAFEILLAQASACAFPADRRKSVAQADACANIGQSRPLKVMTISHGYARFFPSAILFYKRINYFIPGAWGIILSLYLEWITCSNFSVHSNSIV